MRKKLTEPFGKAGLTVAILALVVAMAGGAYAAGGLTKAQEKQVTKIAKKYAGKPGAPGATGPAGAAGGPGAAGKTGGLGPEGPEGPEGKEGAPWTAGGTLPSGRTLKGVWNADQTTVSPFTELHTAVSFALPLAAEPTQHFIKVNEAPPAGCDGGEVLKPTAKPGNLCVYASAEAGGSSFLGFSAQGSEESLIGFTVNGVSVAPAGEAANFNGTWAATAE
jgi:hypothetical protein